MWNDFRVEGGVENNLIWPISFKIGANFTFCNHLDKFVGHENPMKFTFVFGVFPQKFGFWSPRRVFLEKFFIFLNNRDLAFTEILSLLVTF